MPELARRSTDLGPRRTAPAAIADGGDRSKLLSREGSFRVYYTGSSGNVPFKWEARPGTPKHPLAPSSKGSSRPLPPLTPPPSFLSPATPTHGLLRNRRNGHHFQSSSSGLRLVAGFVPRLLLWKKSDFQRRGSSRSPSPRSVLSWAASSNSSSSSESSAVSSPPASPVRSCPGSSRRTRRGRSRFSSFSSTGTSAAYDENETQGENEEEEDETYSPSRATISTTTPWRRSGFTGCSPNMVAVKRALLSVVRVSGSGGPASGAAHKLTDSSC